MTECNPTRVMIVDDDAVSRRTMEEILKPDRYTVFTASNGAGLMERLHRHQPDVLLLDVLLPDANGFDLCRRIKADPHWQHLPVILVTALQANEQLVRGLDAGADEFISKPVHAAELRARVRSMLRVKQRSDLLLRVGQMREDLANMVVHDLRMPLSVCIMRTDMLLGRIGATTAEKPTWLRPTGSGFSPEKSLLIVSEQLRTLSAMVDDILLMAKTDRDRITLNRTDQDLAEIVRLVANEHQDAAVRERINLEIEAPDAACNTKLDRSLVRRMLGNLLSNALKFSPQFSTVRLRLERDPGSNAYLLEVADEGPGVPEADRQRIFDRYAVASTGRQDMRSIGLGLAFCKIVVEAHGGAITVVDNRPVGSVFRVTLPRQQP